MVIQTLADTNCCREFDQLAVQVRKDYNPQLPEIHSYYHKNFHKDSQDRRKAKVKNPILIWDLGSLGSKKM